MIDNRNEARCCGCGACVDICPQNCITMTERTLGAVVAAADPARCIQCGACEAVCPVRRAPEPAAGPVRRAYAGYCLDPELRDRGASGGIVPLIAARLYDQGYAVYGAAFTGDRRLKHICAETPEDLRRIAKSKYLQSGLDGVYTEIRKKLEAGQSVLFIGTPCQNSALRNFVPARHREGLVQVDFFCHGVPSQRFFDECLAFQDAADGSSTISYQFRAKPRRAASPHYFERTAVCGGTVKSATKLYFHSLFEAAFQKHFTLRESCYDCRFSGADRASDLTVGDFHEIDGYFPGIDRFKGVSRIIVNTEKGGQLLDTVRDQLWLRELDMEELQRNGLGFGQKTPRPKGRDAFISLYEAEGIGGLARGPLDRKRYRLHELYYHLPKYLRRLALRAAGGGRR